ncbi:MAG: hypothetical protein IPM29_17855 [Planctomycetes bacterium]|nr:hypothetical protein [Planctomycetota bacterium]
MTVPQCAMWKTRVIFGAFLLGRPGGRGMGSSIGTLARSSDTEIARASAGISRLLTMASSMLTW